MGLRDTISNLSPNEFLAKMQDMFQMYQESQDDYYSEGIKSLGKKIFADRGFKMENMEKYCKAILRVLPKLQGAATRSGRETVNPDAAVMEKLGTWASLTNEIGSYLTGDH